MKKKVFEKKSEFKGYRILKLLYAIRIAIYIHTSGLFRRDLD